MHCAKPPAHTPASAPRNAARCSATPPPPNPSPTPATTPRDRLILDLLADHHTFTTDQLADLAFTSLGRTRNRLSDLHARGVLDRFRHYQRPGSQSWRWTLGPVGAAIVAASRGEPMPRPVTVRDATARLAMSPTLPHLLAVNGFFVALTAHA